MNILIILVLLIVAILFLILIISQLNSNKQLKEFYSKIQTEINNTIVNSLTFLQNQINSTISQVQNTDSTFRQQLELLRSNINEQFSSTISNLNEQMKNSSNASIEGMKIISQQVNENLKNTIETFSKIDQTLGELKYSTEQLKLQSDEIKKSFSSIQLRGGLGEIILEKLLLNIFPQEIVKFQYPVDPYSNERVDAAIVFYEKIIPIDSKFPYEKFIQIENTQDDREKRKLERQISADIKTYIDSISSKYIKPQFNSEFAFMYIPSESIFLRIINITSSENENILTYASSKKVIIASPQTLFPYFQLILAGLQSKKISENIVYIRQQIDYLTNSLQNFIESFSIIGKHIKNAYERFNEAEKDLSYLGQQLKTLYIKNIDANNAFPINNDKTNS